MSKDLRNPSGEKLLKLPNSVRVFPPAVTNVEKVSFAYLQYYPQSTRNFGLYDI